MLRHQLMRLAQSPGSTGGMGLRLAWRSAQPPAGPGLSRFFSTGDHRAAGEPENTAPSPVANGSAAQRTVRDWDLNQAATNPASASTSSPGPRDIAGNRAPLGGIQGTIAGGAGVAGGAGGADPAVLVARVAQSAAAAASTAADVAAVLASSAGGASSATATHASAAADMAAAAADAADAAVATAMSITGVSATATTPSHTTTATATASRPGGLDSGRGGRMDRAFGPGPADPDQSTMAGTMMSAALPPVDPGGSSTAVHTERDDSRPGGYGSSGLGHGEVVRAVRQRNYVPLKDPVAPKDVKSDNATITMEDGHRSMDDPGLQGGG